MRNSIKLLSILLLASGMIFTSCKEVEAPAQLSVSDITSVSAKFSWEGTGDSYEIMVGENNLTSSETFVAATGLKPNTSYVSKVRAKTGSKYSEWVNGTNFKTTDSGTLPDGSILTVTFGGETWTAGFIDFKDLSLGVVEIFASKGKEASVPFVNFAIVTSSKTTDYEKEQSLKNPKGLFFEYANIDPLPALQVGGGLCGNWMVISGSLTLSSNANKRISGSANLVMIDAVTAYRVDGLGDPDRAEKRNLTLTFSNVKISN
jgi:hypothetical protein